MKWFLAYLAIGFVIALISYRFNRRNRNVRKVKKVAGVFGVLMFYTWLWVIGLPFDIIELISSRYKRRKIKIPKKGKIPRKDIKMAVAKAPPARAKR